MKSIKATMFILISVALTAYVLMAVWSGVQPSNAGYMTKKEGVISPEPVVEEVVEVTEIDDESAPNDEIVVTTEVDSASKEESTPEASSETIEQAEMVVEETVNAVVEEVAVVTETLTEAVEAVVNDDNKENEVEGALYNVVDGNMLDAHSYEGFKLYRNWCARCHGTYGQGMVGPNLADSLKVISEKQFFDTVENGKTGTIGSMPSWKANDEVMKGRDQLYAYLKARSDGAIGEVKPKKQ
jgi:hypothetical protein